MLAPNDIRLHLVETYADRIQFQTWLAENLGQPMGIDTETEGLQPFGPKRDRVRLVQFGTVDEGWAIPFLGNESLIRWAIDKANRAGRPYAHNACFDEFMLQEEGIDTGGRWHDTYIMHHLLYPKDYHGLKPVAGQLLGKEARSGEKWLDKVFEKERLGWATVPITHPAYWGYAALDPVLDTRVAVIMEQEKGAQLRALQEQYDREVLLAHLTSEQARHGLRVDVAYAEQLIEKWAEEAELLRKRLERYSIENPNSGRQVAAALQNEGWEPDVLTETGQVSVNKEVLGGLDHEIASAVLRWRRIGKWTKSYALPMAESGGRIHPIISSLRASTGRESVSEPPLQQLPKGPEVRRAILAEEGHAFYAIDYTGQEMRLMCAFSGDPELTRLVLNGEDVHGRIAAVLHGQGYSKEERGWTKNALYAYAFGAGKDKLAATSHSRPGDFEAAVAVAFPSLARFSNRVMELAAKRQKEDGLAWAKTLGGRIVAVPKTKHYALVNYLTQGSGADITKMAHARIAEAGLADRILLKVHDEVLCSLPEASAVEEAETIRQTMEFEFRGVPFEAHSSEPGRNWGDTCE